MENARVDDKVSANDKAFIRVSSELRRLQNSLRALETITKAQRRFDTYAKQYLSEPDPSGAYMSDIEPLVDSLTYLCDDGERLAKLTERYKVRLHQLETLSDTYLRGGDIVAAKLAQ